MNKYFKNDYKINKKKFDYENDWHWNDYGHKLVAKKISEYLNFDSIDKVDDN